MMYIIKRKRMIIHDDLIKDVSHYARNILWHSKYKKRRKLCLYEVYYKKGLLYDDIRKDISHYMNPWPSK